MSHDLDDVLADPARLLTADRVAVRGHIVAAAKGVESVGAEVFLQAEAIFGGAERRPPVGPCVMSCEAQGSCRRRTSAHRGPR